MAKMDKKWVVLCSMAVAAVYTAGYMTTDTQAQLMDVSLQPQASMQPAGQATSKPSAPATAKPAGQPTAKPTTGVKAASLYKDGTFTGMGRNRRGSIEVAVTVKNDKITDVEVSRFAMHYSDRDLEGKPEEVLNIQSAQVKNVSGATYTINAFKDAVQGALSQAKNT